MEFPDFTNEEKDRINELYANDFADITPDDALLIARFEQAKALNDAEFQAQQDALQAETQAKIDLSAEYYEQAISNLNEQHEAAMRRLGAFNDGI